MTENVPASTQDADAWQIAASLVTATTVQERLELLLQAAPRVAGADTATLFLRQDSVGPLEAVARIGYGSDLFGPPRKGGLTEHVLTTGEALVVDDTDADPRINPSVRTAGVRSLVALPLLIRYPARVDESSGSSVEEGQETKEHETTLQAMGVLYVNSSRPHAFSAETVSVLAGLAALASVTIENGLLLESHRVALEGLSEALHVREQFVSLVSHELKGPLTPLKGYAQAIVRRLDRAVKAGQTVDEAWLRRSLGIMVTQIDRLDRLVTDLLDVSRVRAGRFTISPRPLDLVTLAQEVFERFQDTVDEDPATAGAKHIFHWSPATDSLPGLWDPDRLEQLITNLLSNAVKYSPAGGAVELRVELATPGTEVLRQRAPDIAPDWVHLSVRDEGIGLASTTTLAESPAPADVSSTPTGAPALPADDSEEVIDPEHPNLFRAFSRERESEQAGIMGFGLGLYICAEIVRRHGGTIWAESPGPGKGTTFHVLLPPVQ